jgi:hypothetical protein
VKVNVGANLAVMNTEHRICRVRFVQVFFFFFFLGFSLVCIFKSSKYSPSLSKEKGGMVYNHNGEIKIIIFSTGRY